MRPAKRLDIFLDTESASDRRIRIVVTDAVFRESDHPRGQPGNAGQFGPGGGGKAAASPKADATKPSAPKPSENQAKPAVPSDSMAQDITKLSASIKNKSEVLNLTDLLQRRKEAAHEAMNAFTTTGEYTDPAGRRWNGNPVSEEQAGEQVVKIFSSLKASDFARPLSPQQIKEAKVKLAKLKTERTAFIHNAVSETAKKLGFPMKSVEVTNDTKKFKLNGKTCTAGGTAFSDGKIKVYADHVSPDFVAHLMGHEVMHQKYAVAQREIGSQSFEYGQYLDGGGAPIKDAFGQVNVDVARRFPGVMLQTTLNENYDKLRELDGVTPYSTQYWKAYEKAKGTDKESYWHDLAINETLAEIAGKDVSGKLKDSGINTLWLAVYEGYETIGSSEMRARKELE